jgi:hypothetical protein
MKATFYLLILVASVVVLWLMQGPSFPGNKIDYRGQQFKLSRPYLSYEDYKDDANNIDPTENARVEQAVTQAKIDKTYANRQDMVHAVFDLKFPGYGLSSFAEQILADGNSLAGFAVEIPRANKDRVLVFRGRNGAYTLIDDFVTAGDQGIMQVREDGGRLVYCTLDGKQAVTRTVGDK